MIERQQRPLMLSPGRRETRLAVFVLALAGHALFLALLLFYRGEPKIVPPPPSLVLVEVPKPDPVPPERFKPLKVTLAPVTAEVPQFSIAPDPPAQMVQAQPMPAPSAAPAGTGIAGSQPAGAGAPASAPQGDLDAYLRRVSAHIQLYLHQVQGHRAGTAMVQIVFNRDGSLVLVHLAKSSGDAVLDAEAVAVMQRALPLPPIPPDITLARINGLIPVRFVVLRG